MVDYWGKFLKESEKVVRDAGQIVKKNYDIFERNVRNERDRMKERIDCLNRLKDLEIHLTQEAGNVEASDEKKKAFLDLMETIHQIVDCLQNINTLCNPMVGEQPHVNPGANENDISRLDTDRETLRNQINSFRQMVSDNNPEYRPHLAFLAQMDGILQGRALRTICFELRNVIDGGDSESVRRYGGLASALLQQIDGSICMLEWEMRENTDRGEEMLPAEATDVNNDNVF